MALAFLDYAQYGVQTVFYISFEDGSDATELYIGTDIVAGDVKISKDGGALANVSNLPAQITASQPGYSITLTATEMQAARVYVTFRDASAAVWRGVTLTVVNQLSLGSVTIDATQVGGNKDGLYCKGVGTGAGFQLNGGLAGNGAGLSVQGFGTGAGLLSAGGSSGGAGAIFTGVANHGIQVSAGDSSDGIRITGGATTGSGVKISAAAGNNAGLLITGIGSGAGISTTGGTTGQGILATGGATSGSGIKGTTAAGNSHGLELVGAGSGSGLAASGGATGNGFSGVGGGTTGNGFNGSFTSGVICNFFDTLEGSEPAGAIASNASFKQMLQYLKRRFFNKNTQTSSNQITLKDDSATTLQTRTSADDGTTQTLGKAS